MKNTAFLEQSPVRVAELTRMKRLATALLLVVTIIYLISGYFEPAYLWVGYVNAMAEAAMIGAIADWFAVTALFRRPMNLPIPHTAIIPARKDDIARQFGEFVQSNFLSDQVITDKISSLALSKSVATWITRPENARAVADQIAAGLAGITNVLDDKNIQALVEDKVVDKIRTTSFAPMIGDLMTFITSGKRQQDLIDGAVRLGLYMLEDSDEQIRDRVSKETPWWFPGSVDKAIYHRIVRSVSKMLYDMQVDLYHPVRVQLITSINQFLDDLRHSEEIRAKEASLKEDLLQAPAVVNFTGSLWRDIKSLLQTQSCNENSELKAAIEQAVISFGESILQDPQLARKIDGWTEDTARYLIRHYGHEVADLIRDTIDSWDTTATANRIEEQIGRDLQFIRINGTLVGGLIGLLIHTVRQLLAPFF